MPPQRLDQNGLKYLDSRSYNFLKIVPIKRLLIPCYFQTPACCATYLLFQVLQRIYLSRVPYGDPEPNSKMGTCTSVVLVLTVKAWTCHCGCLKSKKYLWER